MSSYDELVSILKELLFNRYLPQPQIIKGLLGDGTGVVRVPGRKDFNYARFNRGSSKSFEVFNKTVPEVDGWPILMSEFPWQPGLIQVVGTDWEAYIQSGWGDSVSTANPHAPTHVWRDGYIGSDPLNVYMRMIAPGRAYSPNSTGTVVYVNSFEYHTGTIWPGTPGIDLGPLMASIPTGTARFAGVYVNPDNTLGVVTGNTSVDTQAFDPPLVTFPFGVIPKARVRLYGGQAGLKEIDFRDARRIEYLPPTGTAGGGDGKVKVSSDDTTPDYLFDKVTTSDAGLALTVSNDGGDEALAINRTGTFPHNILDHADAISDTIEAGDILYAHLIGENAFWRRLSKGVAGRVLKMGATYPDWGYISSLAASDANPDPAWHVDAAGNLLTDGGYLDVDGELVVLDADGDTYVVADVDDQITIVAGSSQKGLINNSGATFSPLLLDSGTFTASNGSNDNISISAAAAQILITGPTGAFTITGIAGGVTGRLLILINNTTQAMTIANASVSSDAANRIITGSADLTTTSFGTVTLTYINGRWWVLSFVA